MHEAGMARTIIDAACRISLSEGSPVTRIIVEVDQRTPDIETVRLHAQAAAHATVADGIEIVIRRVPQLPGDATMRLVSVTVRDE